MEKPVIFVRTIVAVFDTVWLLRLQSFLYVVAEAGLVQQFLNKVRERRRCVLAAFVIGLVGELLAGILNTGK